MDEVGFFCLFFVVCFFVFFFPSSMQLADFG